jgi:hypothetical protein
MYQLDRTAFTAQTIQQADNTRAYWLQQPPHERLRAAWWLTCHAFGIDYNNPPKMEKNFFSSRKHAV